MLERHLFGARVGATLRTPIGTMIIVHSAGRSSWWRTHPDVLHEGYATQDYYHWICERCFQDFRQQLRWTVVADATQQA